MMPKAVAGMVLVVDCLGLREPRWLSVAEIAQVRADYLQGERAAVSIGGGETWPTITVDASVPTFLEVMAEAWAQRNGERR